jgi:undecaprenyl-diphosphatase
MLLSVCFSVSALFLFAVPKERESAKDLASIKIPDAVFVGLAQGAGVLPGVSRSGSTVSTSLVRGIAPAASVAFSLILGLISVGGATILKARKIGGLIAGKDALPIALSFIAALLLSLVCIRLLLLVSVRGRLRYFGYYLLALALAGAVMSIM